MTVILSSLLHLKGKDYTWFVRKTLSPVSYKVIGKTTSSISKTDDNYLDSLVELGEEEITKVKSEMNIHYEFMGQNDEIDEIDEIEEDDGGDMDDLLVELAGGK